MVSQIDVKNLKLIRENVDTFFRRVAQEFDKPDVKILEIAPQTNNSVSQYIEHAIVHTLDIDSNSNSTYIADLCFTNKELIGDNTYDVIVCTEVLEHTLQPFDAVNELYRILKINGTIFTSTPFNLRIHGPLPDCWRFTEHGLRTLFKNFKNVEISQIESDRFLMPIHYTLTAKK